MHFWVRTWQYYASGHQVSARHELLLALDQASVRFGEKESISVPVKQANHEHFIEHTEPSAKGKGKAKAPTHNFIDQLTGSSFASPTASYVRVVVPTSDALKLAHGMQLQTTITTVADLDL